MQIKTRIPALCLALVILIGLLSGCGKKTPDSSDPNGSSSVSDPIILPGESDIPTSDESGDVSDPNASGSGGHTSSGSANSNSNNSHTTPTAPRKLEGNVYTSGTPIVKNKVTLSVMVGKNTLHVNGFDKMAFSTDYEKKTGVHIEWQTVENTDFGQRVTTVMSSGKYPDVIFGINALTGSQVERYGKAKMFLSLEDSIEKWAPNAAAAINSNSSYKKQVYFGNKLYSLPSVDDNLGHQMFPLKMFINQKWLTALNLPMPTTYDELLTVLQKFKSSDPNRNGQQDEIPFSCETMSPLIAGAPQGVEWKFSENDACYVDRSGNVGYFYTSNACKSSLTFLHKVFSAGCLDWAAFCGTQTVAKSVATGRVGCFIDFTGTLDLPAEYCNDYVAIGPIKADANSTPAVPTGRMDALQPYAMVITKAAEKDQKKEIALRWVDWFYTQEGDFYRQFGPEGTGMYTSNGDGTYKLGTKTVDGKKVNMTDSDRYAFAPGYVISGRKYDQTNVWTYEKGVSEDPRDKFFNEQDTKQITKLYTPYINQNYLGYLKISASNENKLAGYKSTLHQYTRGCMLDFVSGGKNIDTEWNDYLTKAKKYGADDLIKIYQDAYNSK